MPHARPKGFLHFTKSSSVMWVSISYSSFGARYMKETGRLTGNLPVALRLKKALEA